ncbi:proline-rich protein 32 [Psammomys obesus]|uniref:proline-rich protein 32 n=1 Tax=Psammomys obesus TaxID=48139 RepID=UPI0024533603|nr:proline-rich protein 32 [Psammomys obesus]
MACIENGLGRHSHSFIMVPVDKNTSRGICHNVQLWCLNSMLNDDEDDAETWACPPVFLKPPFMVPRSGASIPENPRALTHPFTLTPAIKAESLATTEVNISEGLEGQSQKANDSINKSREFCESSEALIIRGPRVGSGVLERSGSNSKPVPRAQGFFSPRGFQSGRPPYIPTLRSGIMMERTPGNARMAYKGNLVPVYSSLGSQRHPMANWQQRPLFLSSSILDLPCSAAHCILPPQAPAFNPFPMMPTAFAFPLRFAPPLLPYFLHYNTRAMYPPHPYLN